MMNKKYVNDKKSVTKKTNVKKHAISVLKTLNAFKKPISVTFLVNILTGSNVYGWKKGGPENLDTFGIMGNAEPVKAYRMVQILLDHKLIEGVAHSYSVIRVTAQGKKYLEVPTSLWVFPSKLKYSSYDYALFHLLREIRSSFGEQEAKEEAAILPAFTLDRIAYLRPQNKQGLASIPGMTQTRMKKLGPAILKALSIVREKELADRRRREVEKMKSPTFQQTKYLWEKGYSAEEIGEIKGITHSSAKQYLERLHFANEIDMRPWIEDNLDSKALYKGVEFFKQVAKPSLKEAYEALGLDYETLRYCRMYVHGLKQQSVQLAIAA